MRIKYLAKGHYTAAASKFEPMTSRLRVRGVIHWAITDNSRPVYVCAINAISRKQAGRRPRNSHVDPVTATR